MRLPVLPPAAVAARDTTYKTVPGVYGHSSSGTNPGVVAGIVLGVALAFIFVICTIYCWVNRGYRQSLAHSAMSSSVMSMPLGHDHGRSRSAHSYMHARTDSHDHVRRKRSSASASRSRSRSHRSVPPRTSQDRRRRSMHAQRPFVVESEVGSSDIIEVTEDVGSRQRPQRKPVPPPRHVEESTILDIETSEDEIVVEETGRPSTRGESRYGRRSQSMSSDYISVTGDAPGDERRRARRG